MRPWRVRLALRRSRVQWALLSVVLLVATLASTLLCTLFLLSDATETFAARAALTEAEPQDVRVVQRVAPDGPLLDVITASQVAAAEFFGDVPFSTSIHAESGTLALPREDEDLALGYLATMDGAQERIRLTSGAMPAQGSDDEVIVPEELMTRFGLEVGDTIDVSSVFQREDVTTMRVVGSYLAREPETDYWRFDRFQGRGYNPATPVPFSGGQITVDGYGPLLGDLEALRGLPIDTLNVEYLPDFSTVSLSQAQDLMGRVEAVERTTVGSIGAIGDNVRVLTSIDTTLGRVIGSLAVTRSSVLVTGLLLLVLSIAALAQTARLMGERRHGEQSLMIARGASGRQLVRLALIEAVVVAVITAAASPVLATGAYRLISSRDAMARAGMNQDPGIPGPTWVVAGIVAVILIAVLVAPLLRRGASFIDAEQSRARPGRRAAFQRGGIDIALVALAGLAYWQLRSYESPVISDGGVARLDPLLAAGPALALLAGALVAVRLIPAASKLLEGLAARGRRAVMPLAAWEVGRRAARAVSAILLLTLAVSIGTFAMAYLATWRVSQDDQAQFQHPADAVVSHVPGSALVQRSDVDNADTGAVGFPALSRGAVVSTQLEDGFGGNDGLDGRDAHLVASTEGGLAFYGEGRTGDEGGAAIPAALPATVEREREPIALPGEAAGLSMEVVADVSATALPDIQVLLRAVVRDGAGTIATVELGVLPVDGESRRLQAPFAASQDLARLAQPFELIGVQSVWLSTAGDDFDAAALAGEAALTLTLSIDDISSLEYVQAVPVDGADAIYRQIPADVTATEPWFASESFVNVRSLEPVDDQLHAEMLTSANALRFRPAALVQTVQPALSDVPLVLTRAMASTLSAEEGDRLRIEVDGTVVFAVFADTVSLLPSENPRQDAVIANIDDLNLALVHAGAAVAQPDQWWVAVDDEATPAYAASLPDEAQVTTRIGVATALKEDPLRVATQAALWLVTGAAVLLAAVGFAVHAVVTVRARQVEFAQLRAVGIGRSQLVRVVAIESLLLTVLGVAFGVGLGLALGYLVAPLVAVGADGRPPVPSVIVEVPWTTVGLLALEAAVVLVVAVLLVSVMLRRINPAQTMRMGEQ